MTQIHNPPKLPTNLDTLLREEMLYSEQHKDTPMKPGTRVSRLGKGDTAIVEYDNGVSVKYKCVPKKS